ncbi:DegT/DnrJ/EryC1/StrS family aminotransferase [Streptomyces triticagri]|uniref:DegT/DnrJ/EryC1/StrS family aminotransferase n=1 Tax=Streptomyces triticagri TaxID=2293568 RepID=A0A372M2S3_9ACTN|nr:DegT/DnrJ/EryC1/StrS family aminotransferase [Streptomyces triticagri]RFU85222.1 DegT/DnrJ/EryC1/StrS family aminotransferase [Streptomyces triticagri]
MSKLAMFGGVRTVTPDDATPGRIGWPVVTDAEREATLRVLDSGQFTSNNTAGEVQLLEREWADYVGTRHCSAVSNGTAAIELALAAAGIEPGGEVLVPAFTFIASAIGPVQRSLTPVFVDIDPVTFCMDPVAAEAAVTPRTRAVLVVHLHGLPADMAAFRALADRHGLLLIEDAAQSHAATYRGARTGSLGDIATFSLNVVKNLPTCGEGGLVTTDSAALHQGVELRRQFGEKLQGAKTRDYRSRMPAGNEKLSAVQAAFARAQLARLDDYHAARDRNVRAFLDRIGQLRGIRTPYVPDDRTHAWHILRLRFDPEQTGHPDLAPGALRSMLQRALRAEGVPVQPYQLVPLPGQPAFDSLQLDPADFPVTCEVIDDSLTLQRWHLNPASGPVLQRIADAFEKVWEHLDVLCAAAAGIDHRPAWRGRETAEAAR